ncbi:TrlF family AAA-like ATPase [Empedobacter sp. GD03797]|uniref:TrlF family AAA-like ATPase n=1 Tax=Empedobacter sp. GD03797 TaxID=2975382 RepID=UPI00244760B8|nr:hypothetical protein [Empedobacter sp. GD03797]MDH1884126.1 hypothetical protein [Empedobacter sp. GD03797]
MRGSEWNKWDLHIHSPLTNGTANKYGLTTIDEFCNKIIENGIKCIGLTNYFYITQNEFDQVNNKLKGKCCVIPNFEFRVSDKNNKGDHINVHILFNPVINLNNILNVLGRVKIHNRIDKFCTIEDINELGLEAISVDFETLLTELNKSFKPIDDYIIITPYTGYGGFKNDSKPRNCETERKFDKYSHIIFGNKTYLTYFIEDRIYAINNNTYIEDSKKAILECSDAHSIDKVNEKFTWIKAENSFEGLKQIIFEPIQRAKIQKDKPDFKEDKVVIEKVKFISDNNTFNNEEIHLNQNLNVIIGGKSSGKSILLYSIAKTLLPDQEILKNDTGKEKYNLKEIDSNFNFEITTKAGINQLLFRDTEENSIIPDIKYIPQNYLVKLAETEINDKGRSLNKLVRDLINEDSDSKAIYDNFIKQVQQLDKARDNKINHYFSLLDDLKKCEDESKTKSNKEVLETNIATNNAKVEELNKQAGLTPEQLEQYKELQKQEIINKANFEAFTQDFDKTNTFLTDLEIKLKDIKVLKSNFLSSLKNTNISAFYSDKFTSINQMLEEVELCKEEIKITVTEEKKKVFINENVLKSEISLIITERDRINQELVLFKQTDEVKKQVDTLNQSIQSDQKLLKEIDELSKIITEVNTKIIECKTELFQLYDEVYDQYQLLIEALKERTNELEKDGLEIEGIPQFNFKKIYNKIIDLSDGRRASYKDYEIILDEAKKPITEYNYQAVKEELKKVFDAVMDDSYSITSKTNKKDFIKVLLDDYFFDYWKITYKNDKLGEMSTGKASFVILMLIIGLSKSKSPILIDQPEDNLDNRSITRDLVDYLKNKKLERQIIVVTHNANIVVNADAENIIVANQKGQNNIESTSPYKFDYINGAIENTKAIDPSETDLLKSMGIREHIAEIVEGGKDAFMLREKKYRFIREI